LSSKGYLGRQGYCKACVGARQRAQSENPRRQLEPGTKYCPGCAVALPIEAFGSNRSSGDGRTAYCKPCHNQKGRESKERMGGSRQYHLKRRYGIGAADVDAMVERQGGLCAICREGKAEHVDHDHVTGLVRGILCFNCNGGLGQFKDSMQRLAQASAYLKQTSTWQKYTVAPGVTYLHQPNPGRQSAAS